MTIKIIRVNGIDTKREENNRAPTTKSNWSRNGAGPPLLIFILLLMKLPQASPITAPAPIKKPNSAPWTILTGNML